MDKKEFIEILNKHYGKIPLQTNDVVKVIESYCIDKGVTSNLSQFIDFILIKGNWRYYFEYAIYYYEIKFSIHKLYSKPDPRNMGDGRTLLKIF